LTDALVVSEARHKTIASWYRLMVEAPDPSNGADTLRISPWTAEDLRAPLRHFIVADLVAYAPGLSICANLLIMKDVFTYSQIRYHCHFSNELLRPFKSA
jgi:hypothetical protein